MLLASYLLLLSAAASGLVSPDPGKGAKPVQVEFDAPAGCSSADAFFSSLRSRTDEVRQSDGNEPHTTLQVRLTRARGRVIGELRVVDDRGGADTRKMQGASCDDVVQALSLTAALALDPNALLSAPASAPVPTTPETEASATSAVAKLPKPPEAAQAKTTDTLTAAAARVPRDVPWLELGAGAVGTALLTSSASPGLAVSSRWTPAGSGVLRTTVGLAFVYARNDIVQSPGALQVSLAGLAATVCPLRLSASILTIQPCALVVAGWLSASGRETTHTYDVDHLWLGAGGVLHLSASIGDGLSLDLDGGVSAALFKRRFYSTTPGNIVGETPTISPIISFGVSYGF